VLAALGERDGAARDAEVRAGARLAMTEDEGLFVRVEWCGSGVSVREATRLRRLADQHSSDGTGGRRLGVSVQRVWPPHRGTDLIAPAGGAGCRA
jgi:hypothetical protein